MRRTTASIAVVLGVAVAGTQPASAGPPMATNPLGPLSRPSARCISFDPSHSGAPVKPNGWYAIGLSAPGQVPFQLIPKSRLASWSGGLTPAHNDLVGDGFIGNTKDGNGPKPGTSGPGGGVGWVHYYGWSTEG